MIEEIVADIAKDLPIFPDGRIDYTHAKRSPVINAAVFYGDELMITRRSDKLKFYPGLWNGVSGFIDEIKPIEQIVSKELEEELGIEQGQIERIVIGDLIERKSTKHDRVWMVYPILVELKEKPAIKLDWEHSAYAWIKPEELKNYETLADFEEVVARALNLRGIR